MPMYDYQCKTCAAITTRFKKIVDRNDAPTCDCDSVMRLAILSAPATQVQPEAHYLCPATGQEVTSWRQRKNLFAKHDLIQADPDRNAETQSRNQKKARDQKKIAENYLPKDLREKLTSIGSTAKEQKDRFTL